MLDIKPILEIRDGVIEPVARVRTYPRAIDRVVEECQRAAAAWGGAEVVIAHADRPRVAAELVERMRPLVSGEPALTVVGPWWAATAGPGPSASAFTSRWPDVLDVWHLGGSDAPAGLAFPVRLNA